MLAHALAEAASYVATLLGFALVLFGIVLDGLTR